MHFKLLVNSQRFEKRQAHSFLPSRSYSVIMIEKGSINLQVYNANSDRNSVIVNTLIQPIEARFIRVYPESWHGHMSMRMELYGCEIHSGKKTHLGRNHILKDLTFPSLSKSLLMPVETATFITFQQKFFTSLNICK